MLEISDINNSWPVWLIATAVILSLLPKATQGLAILIPPLSDWLKARENKEEVILHSQLDNEKFNLQQDAQMIGRLLNVVEQTLKERADSARETTKILGELQKSIDSQTRMIDRVGQINTALNGSITGLTDRVVELGAKMNSLQWYVIGNNHDREGANALEREQNSSKTHRGEE